MSESYGFLGTYPPTQCGLATFTASMVAALRDAPDRAPVGVVQVVEGRVAAAAEVVHQTPKQPTAGSAAAAAAALDRFDVAVVQHEYGIFGGHDGDAVLDIAGRVGSPLVVVAHTVLAEPTPHQRAVLAELAERASAVVVMTETARRRMSERYGADPAKVELIAHGAPTDWSTGPAHRAARHPTLLTWGLLGPGKGIEWAIDALAGLDDLHPHARYVVAGQTHPTVLRRDGEAYRSSLRVRARARGVDRSLSFVDRYLDRRELRSMVAEADVVVLPYDSADQVTSGVLIEAVTARRPVVATAFPHAVELLSSGAGLVVRQGHVGDLTSAIRRVLTEPGLARSMSAEAERLAPDLTWAAVAAQYRRLGQRLCRTVAVADA